jgi:crotonobetainyl-CoA:carnitine CoA-transferase CaiB-like acyl-CoA transferase
LRPAGLPCAKVATIDEVVEDPQLRHREMLVDIEHPTVGRFPTHGVNIKLSETPGSIRRPPPLLGQHNDEVLGEWLGLSTDAVAQLRTNHVI